MTTKIVEDLIKADHTSTRTAAQVRALLPGQWATDGDVPLYLYKSVREILVPAYTVQDYQKAVVGTLGIGAVPEDACVQIAHLPKESILAAGMKSDYPGAECAVLRILCQLHEDLDDGDKDIVEFADLRVRWLIDITVRSKRRKAGDNTVTPALPAAADKTVIDNMQTFPVLCSWEGFIDNESAIAKASLYKLQYTRAFV